jgi:hypothetical protein
MPEHTTTIVGDWLKMGDSGTWSARGIQIFSFVFPFDMPLSLVTGSSGSLEVWHDFAGTPTLLGTATSALADPDTFYNIEMKVFWSTTAGTVELRVDGLTVLNLTGLDLDHDFGPQNVEFDTVYWDGSSTPCDITHDDIYVLDEAGSWANDFLGPRDILCLVPTADYDIGNARFTHSDPHYLGVNSLPYDPSDPLVKTDPLTAQDLFTMSDVTGSGLIPAIQCVLVARNPGGTSTSYSLSSTLINDDGIAFLTAQDFDSGTAWQYALTLSTENEITPGSAWTVDVVNALYFGATIVTSSGGGGHFPIANVAGVYIEVISPSPFVATTFSFGTIIGL